MKRLRSLQRARRSSRRNHRALRGEQLEDRRVMAASPLFLGLGDLPGGDYSSSAFGVSADGQTVVGRGASAATGQTPISWNVNDQIMRSLGALPDCSLGGTARNASADGSVIVGHSCLESFRWDGGAMSSLPGLPGDEDNVPYDGAYDVSADGTIVVGATPSSLGTEAYLWTDGQGTVGLGDLPGGSFKSVALGMSGDGSAVVGFSESTDGMEAFRWTADAGMVALPGSGSASESRSANDVSADGSVVIGWETVETGEFTGRGKKRQPVYDFQAVRWTDAGIEHLGDFAGGDRGSLALAMSADGSIIAGESDSASGIEAFIWDEGNGMQKLQDVLVNEHELDLTGWQLMKVWDMTPDGTTFVGEAINPEGNWEGFYARIGPATPGVTITPIAGLETTEAGGTAGFKVTLDTQPTADVTIALESTDETEGTVDVASLTFTSADWDSPQTFHVAGVDDSDMDGDVPYQVVATATSSDPVYDPIEIPDVSLVNVDNDYASVDNAIYVSSFEIVTSQRGKHTYYEFIVEVRYDSNQNGMADGGDALASGVTVVVSLYNSPDTNLNNDSNIRNFLGSTNDEGIYHTYGYKGLDAGKDYRVEVHDLSLAEFVWDPFGELEIGLVDIESGLGDEDEDGRPDIVFTA